MKASLNLGSPVLAGSKRGLQQGNGTDEGWASLPAAGEPLCQMAQGQAPLCKQALSSFDGAAPAGS